MALLSIAVFFSLVSGRQAALIQGMRRIADLAKMNVLGALSRTLLWHSAGVFLPARREWCLRSLRSPP